MADQCVGVTLILNGSYGDRANEDAKRGPVWLAESPENISAALELRRQYSDRGDYITVFKSGIGSEEEICLDLISDIDLHHPDMNELTVIGAALTPRIRSALGSGNFNETERGFVFLRHQ